MGEGLDVVERGVNTNERRIVLIREIKGMSRLFEEALVKVRELTSKINEKRSNMRELKRELRVLKREKHRIYMKLSELSRSRRELISKYRMLVKELPKESLEQLAKTLEELEWRIQTAPLSREGEKELVSRAMDLELKLNRQKRALALRSRINELDVEMEEAERELGECNLKIGKNSKLLADEEFRKMLGERERLRGELDRIKEEIRVKLNELEGLSKKIEERRKRRIMSGEVDRKALLNESKKRIMKKLERGEKLDFDELRILYGIDLNR